MSQVGFPQHRAAAPPGWRDHPINDSIGQHPVLAPRDGPSTTRASPLPNGIRARRTLSYVGWILALVAVLCLSALPAFAQMAPGDAVVTGFSGFKPIDPPVSTTDPLDNFVIDADGNAAAVLRLQASEAPQAQLLPTTPVLQIKAGQVGQVFAVTLAPRAGATGAQTPPDIYLGATSAFGIQIVKPGPDGRPQRLRTGDPAAQWMDGQFGAALGGGPGSIYKVDGQTGAATLFATIENSGPGLGGVVYDPVTRQFFASSLDTGLIHRLDVAGMPLDTFDHGVAARTTRGLPPVPDDGVVMDIKSPAFKVEDSATWGFTPAARMVYGMAVFGGRLYYAVAEGSQIWSIGLRPDNGAFAGDPRWEVDVPGVPPGALITGMAFDSQGRMYVALRGAPRGSYNYSVFAEKTQTDVKRFRRELPNDPATPGTWVAVPEEYAIGFPDPFRNASGGVAFGYDHDASGAIKRGTCGGFVWSTGDNLRNNPTYAAQLDAGGALEVHGLQGNATSQVRPQNQPPLASYFVDYDGEFGDPERVGHIGNVAIWQVCETTTGGQPSTLGVVDMPVVEPGPVIPPLGLITCPPGYSPVTGGCVSPPVGCEPGWTPTPIPGKCCPPGKPWTGKQCGSFCPPGWTPTPVPGKCCPPGHPWNGAQCGNIGCPPGWTPTPVPGKCCPPGHPWNGKQCGGSCPPGTVGMPPNCQPIVMKPCPPGWTGMPPNCHKPIVVKPCPPGWTGMPPHCKSAHGP